MNKPVLISSNNDFIFQVDTPIILQNGGSLKINCLQVIVVNKIHPKRFEKDLSGVSE